MNNDEITRYARDSQVVAKRDRQLAAEARQIYNEARLSALKVDGVVALAGRIMDGMVGLDSYRQSQPQTDSAIITALYQIQNNALRAVTRIQNDLYT